MRRRFRAFVVVVTAVLAAWGGWWWVRHSYVSSAARPAAGVVVQPVAASPQVCVEPNGTVVNNCAEKLATGQVVLVAPAQTTTTAVIQRPVAAQAEGEEQPVAETVEGAAGAASGPCVTPAGDIYAPDCAAPPAAPPPPANAGGGGGGPAPCATPAGAIYSSC